MLSGHHLDTGTGQGACALAGAWAGWSGRPQCKAGEVESGCSFMQPRRTRNPERDSRDHQDGQNSPCRTKRASGLKIVWSMMGHGQLETWMPSSQQGVLGLSEARVAHETRLILPLTCNFVGFRAESPVARVAWLAHSWQLGCLWVGRLKVEGCAALAAMAKWRGRMESIDVLCCRP